MGNRRNSTATIKSSTKRMESVNGDNQQVEKVNFIAFIEIYKKNCVWLSQNCDSSNNANFVVRHIGCVYCVHSMRVPLCEECNGSWKVQHGKDNEHWYAVIWKRIGGSVVPTLCRSLYHHYFGGDETNGETAFSTLLKITAVEAALGLTSYVTGKVYDYLFISTWPSPYLTHKLIIGLYILNLHLFIWFFVFWL